MRNLDIKKFLFGFLAVVFVIIAMAISGQFGRDLGKRKIFTKKDVEIKYISDQYANASKQMTIALSEFWKSDQEIKSSIEQLKSLKILLIKSKEAFEHHEEIRQKGLNYLMNHENAFEREFYDRMYFYYGLELIRECNNSYIEFSAAYLEFIDFVILNFDEIVSSTEPFITYYNNESKNCENLRQKYNEAYLKKMNAIREKYGDEVINIIAKELQN